MRRVFSMLALMAFLPLAARAEDFRCPTEGRLDDRRAPSDFPSRPDARCVVGGLLYFVGADGTPYPQMTRVGPGWYFSAKGYRQADELFQRRGRERDTAEARATASAGACAKAPEACGTSSTTAAPAPEVKGGSSATGVLVALGVGLLVGAVGGAYLTARALR